MATPRLMKKYNEEIVAKLQEKLDCKNKMAIPKLQKIVVSMGVGRTLENKKRLEHAVRDMVVVTGQKPLITTARQSIAGFKLREGQAIGCKVTLRGVRMYEFFDRLVSIVIPRIRDFRGLRNNAFDGRGNYSMGITDQSVFPEINLDAMEFTSGMNITFVMKNSNDKNTLETLKLFGMPFKS